VILRPVEGEDISTVAGWLADEHNRQWLDFGAGRQVLSASSLKIMTQRDLHLMRLFAPDVAGPAVGLVALSDVDPTFGTARLWYVRGEKESGGRGLTSLAVSGLLGLGFNELGLGAINAWAVEHNRASIRVLEKNNFRPIGRQRRCHRIDSHIYDRLWFDLVAEEYRPL
jgi:RimJ/RimL family protein N-acetyltransferase